MKRSLLYKSVYAVGSFWPNRDILFVFCCRRQYSLYATSISGEEHHNFKRTDDQANKSRLLSVRQE